VEGTSTTCQTCPVGTYSLGNTAVCIPCAANTGSVAGSGVCCASNYYMTAGATACTACPSNSGSAAGAGKCNANAGYFGPTLNMFDGVSQSYGNLGSSSKHVISPVSFNPAYSTIGSKFAPSFDSSASGGYLTVSNYYSEFTLAFWMRIDKAFDTANSFQFAPVNMRATAGTTDVGFNFDIGSNGAVTGVYSFYLQYGDTAINNNIRSSTTFSRSVWYHVVLVAPQSPNTRTIKVFIDGQFKTPTSAVADGTADMANYQTLVIGANVGDTRYFTGQLQQLWMYNYAMSAAQVTTLYNTGTTSTPFISCSPSCAANTYGHCTPSGTAICCGAGTYFVEGTSTTCEACPVGTYSDGSSASCTPCAAGLNSPAGSASCSAEYPVYALVVDWTGGTVRKVDAVNGGTSTVSESLSNPAGVALSPFGDYALVTAYGVHKVFKINIAAKTTTVLAGSGTAGAVDATGTAASLNGPMDIKISPDATYALFVEQNIHCVRKVSLLDGTVVRIAGSGTTTGAYMESTGTSIAFNGPVGVGISSDGSFALVTEYDGHRIRKITLTGGVVTSSLVAGSAAAAAGSPGSADGAGTSATFRNPQGIVISNDMTFALVADRGNSMVRKVLLSSPNTVSTLASVASSQILGISLSALEDFAIVVGFGTHKVYQVTYPGGTTTTISGTGTAGEVNNAAGASAQFNSPHGLAVWRCSIKGYGMSSSSTSCARCPAGKYGSGNGLCTPCPAGTYSTGVGIRSAAECLPCGANTYAAAGATVCASCVQNSWAGTRAAAGRCMANVGFYDLGSSLMAYYPFNSGNVLADISGVTGTLTASPSSPTSQSTGPFGVGSNSVVLVGSSSQYFTVPTLTFSSSFTICTWYFIDASVTPSYQVMFAFESAVNGANDIIAYLPSGTTQAQLNNVWSSSALGQVTISGASATKGGWYHIAIGVSGTSGTGWINGAQAATTTFSSARSPMTLTVNAIGRNPGSANNYWTGAFDEFRVYNRLLSLAEVQAIYSFNADTNTPVMSVGCTIAGCAAPSSIRCLASGTGICCAPGTYFIEGTSASCLPCPAGTYSTTGGQTSCTKCATPNTYSTSATSAVCVACVAGTGLVDGVCVKDKVSGSCQAGTYLSGSSCFVCKAGKYSPAGVSVCFDCPANSYSGDGAASCVSNAGYYAASSIDILATVTGSGVATATIPGTLKQYARFTGSSGTITFPAGMTVNSQVLVVGGGGSGGVRHAGGGGAGAVVYNSGQSFTGGSSYTITVGAGGAAVTVQGVPGNDGIASSISLTNGGSIILLAQGGGGGGQGSSSSGRPGGCSGGAVADIFTTSAVVTSNVPQELSYGFTGGIGSNVLANSCGGDGPCYAAGGGGGAGGSGGSAVNHASLKGGNGGNGYVSYITGVCNVYAGGGAGGVNSAGTAGVGGGGYCSGSLQTVGGGSGLGTNAAGSGVANTGSGGGGGGFSGGTNGNVGAGSAGVVIISWDIPATQCPANTGSSAGAVACVASPGYYLASGGSFLSSAMTASASGGTASTQTIGGESVTVTTSSTYSASYASAPFDGISWDWSPSGVVYSTGADGAYTGGTVSTLVDGVSYGGEWIQIAFQTARPLGLYSLTTQSGGTLYRRSPANFIIAGSNGGVQWTAVDVENIIWSTPGQTQTLYPSLPPYRMFNTFRLIIRTIGGSSDGRASITEWTLYSGTPTTCSAGSCAYPTPYRQCTLSGGTVCCGAGTYWAPAANVGGCTLCPLGTYGDGSSTSCTSCASGKFAGYVGSSACQLCASGMQSDTGASVCIPATVGQAAPVGQYYDVGLAAYTPCTSGYTCAGGAAGQVACVGGYVCLNGTAQMCSTCAAGKFISSICNATADAGCADCGTGTYSDAVNLASADLCVKCAAGTYSSGVGIPSSSQCTGCTSGTYSSSLGAIAITTCSQCALGKYCSTPATQTNCTSTYYCPAGTVTPALCPLGSVCATPSSMSGCDNFTVGDVGLFPPRLFSSASASSSIIFKGGGAFKQTVVVDSAAGSYGAGSYDVYISSINLNYGNEQSYLLDLATDQFEHPSTVGFGAYNYYKNELNWNNKFNAMLYCDTSCAVDSLDGSYRGDWFIIKTPTPLSLSGYVFELSKNFDTQGPAEYKVYGSNDGISFTELFPLSAITPIVINSWKSKDLYMFTYNATFTPLAQSYSYFAFVVGRLIGSSDALGMVLSNVWLIGKGLKIAVPDPSRATSCPAGSTVSAQCPLGSFCPDASTVTSCTSPNYCALGSPSQTPCPVGNYCPTPSTKTLCDSTNYCAAGSISQTKCLAGYVCATPFTQVQCAAGSWCPEGTVVEGACTAGYYCTTPASRAVCSVCTAGNFVKTACTATANTVCQACGTGVDFSTTSSAPSCTACSACISGQYTQSSCITTANAVCQTCTAGSYCSNPATGVSGTCTALTNFCLPGVTAPTVCTTCLAGTYRKTLCTASSNTVCTPCVSAANYSTYSDAPTCSACSPCGTGQYVTTFCSTTVNTVCAGCPAGSYCPDMATATVTLCAGSYYCPANTVSPSLCLAGYYCPNTYTQTLCVSSQYCPTGSTVNALCPVGSYCPNTTTKITCTGFCPAGSTAQNPCPPGFFCADAMNKVACDLTYYCPTGTVAQALCPAGSYCADASTIVVCDAGYYCPAGSLSQTKCALGSYCSNTSSQLPCSSGYYCPAGTVTPQLCPVGNACATPSSSATCDVFDVVDGNYPPQRFKNFTAPITDDIMGNIHYHETFYVDPSYPSPILYGSGLYRVYYGTIGTDSPRVSALFNKSLSTTVSFEDWRYTNGVFTGSAIYKNLQDTYLGDWVALKLPLAISVTGFKFTVERIKISNAPGEWRMYGSMDGRSFVEIGAGSVATRLTATGYVNVTSDMYGNSLSEYTHLLGSPSAQYNHFGFTFKKLVGASAVDRQLKIVQILLTSTSVSVLKSADSGLAVSCLAGSTASVQCPSGSFCPDASTVTPCVSTNYCAVGSPSQTICPVGYFCPNPSTKTLCDSTYFCPAGSITQNKCLAGSYCPNTTSQFSCTSGSYCPSGSTTEADCALGSYCPNTSTQILCTQGNWCPARRTAQLPCPLGFYCSSPSDSTACASTNYCAAGSTAPTTCDLGSYCANSSSRITCVSTNYCPAGSTAQTKCDLGSFCTTPSTRTTCGSTYYCAVGSTVQTLCLLGSVCTTPQSQVPCMNGNWCPAGTTLESQCPLGSFCATPLSKTTCTSPNYCASGSTAQAPCSAGFFCPDPSTKTSCSANQYCLQGVTSGSNCTVCTNGQYVASVCSATANTVCPVCTNLPTHATYTGVGSNISNCQWVCDLGYYLSNGQCVVCPTGSWCAANVQNTCPTNADSVVLATTQNQCLCKPGYAGDGSVSGTSPCPVCRAGFYCPGGNTNLSVSCPGNFSSPVGSSAYSSCQCVPGFLRVGETCQLCGVGQICISGQLSTCPTNSMAPGGSSSASDCVCNPGFYGANGFPCTECPEKSFCPGGNVISVCTSNAVSPVQSTNATACYCDRGYQGVANAACSPCAANTWCWTGVLNTCPANTVSPPLSSWWNNCTCVPGYTGIDGSACTACVAGSYKTNGGSASCTQCPANNYCSVASITSIACPIAHTNSPVGSLTASQCVCDAGYYGAQCDLCPVAYVCPGGGPNSTRCPNDGYTVAGASSASQCLCPADSTLVSTLCTCSPGFERITDVASPAGWRCDPCGADHYCLAGVSTACPALSTAPASSSLPSACQCGDGYFMSSGVCVVCGYGSYAAKGTVGACAVCPPYSSTSATGSSALSQCLCVTGNYGNATIAMEQVTVSLIKSCGGATCPVSAYSTYDNLFPSRAVDGVFTTEWNHNGQDPATGYRWWRIDFQTPRYISRGTVSNLMSGTASLFNDQMSRFQVWAGSDSSFPGTNVLAYYSPNAAVRSENFTVNAFGRYLYMAGNNTDWGRIGELAIFSDGTPSCGLCPSDTYCPGGQVNYLVTCPDSKYSVAGSSSVAQCACPVSSTWLQSLNCTCNNGTYKVLNSAASLGGWQCNTCPATKYCQLGNAVACPAGYSCPANTVNPVICPLGYYCVASVSAPVACPVGTYAASTGTTSLAGCLPCGYGYYSTSVGSSVCAACQINTNTTVTNANLASQCVCDPGYYMTGGVCVQCGYGTHAKSGAVGACSVCPPSSNTTAPGSSDATMCLCQAGYTGSVQATQSKEMDVMYACGTSQNSVCGYTILSGGILSGTFSVDSMISPGSCSGLIASANTDISFRFELAQVYASLNISFVIGQLQDCNTILLERTNKLTISLGTTTTNAVACYTYTYKSGDGGTFKAGTCAGIAARYITISGESGLQGYFALAKLFVNAASSCSQCTSDFYCPGNQVNYSLTCPNSLYSLPGASTVSQCVCPANSAHLPGLNCTCNNGTTKVLNAAAPLGGWQCNACPESKYCQLGITVACPAGYYCPVSTIYPIVCPKGSYCLASSSSPTACPAGTYAPNTGITSLAGCLPCGYGYYSTASGSSVCATCPLNTNSTVMDASAVSQCVCNPGYFMTSNMCIKCDRGTYSARGAVGSCTFCPANSNTTALGSSVYGQCLCTPGYAGEIISASSLDCKQCVVNAYCPGAQVNYTVVCPNSTFSYAGSSTSAQCVCPANSSVINGACMCKDGAYKVMNPESLLSGWQCDACPPGSDCKNGVQSSCPAGYFCAPQSISPVVCPAGAYCLESVSEPTLCPAGTYNAHTGATTEAEGCIPCGSGFYSTVLGSTQCSACQVHSNTTVLTAQAESQCVCDAGYVMVGGVCQLCGYGTYSAQGASGICTLCIAHSNTTSMGSTLASQCICGVGYVAANGSCEDCPADSYCAGGGVATVCPIHLYSLIGSVTSSQCRCPANSQLSPSGCVCDNGFSHKTNAAAPLAGWECETCAAGSLCINGSVAPCAAGYSCSAGGASVCPVNRYCPEGVSTSLACPPTAHSTAGSAACTCNDGYLSSVLQGAHFYSLASDTDLAHLNLVDAADITYVTDPSLCKIGKCVLNTNTADKYHASLSTSIFPTGSAPVFTLAFWMNLQSVNPWRGLVELRGAQFMGTADYMELFSMNTLTDAETQGPGTAFNEHTGFFEPNVWHHVAITFSHGYYALYRDGVQLFTKQGVWSDGGVTVHILNQNAYFDEIYFVASELLPSDVATLYTSNSLCGPCTANTFCAGGVSFSCPSGAVSPSASASVANCSCASGFFASAGSCVTCPPGRFCPGGSISSTVSSSVCPAGSFCSPGMSTPTSCSDISGECALSFIHTMVCLLIRPLQVPTAQLAPPFPTSVLPAFSARRRRLSPCRALWVGSVPSARSPRRHAQVVPIPRPPSRRPLPRASSARRVRSGPSNPPSAPHLRIVCVLRAPTSPSGPRSLRPVRRVRGCVIVGTMGIPALSVVRGSGASPESPTAVRLTAPRLRSRIRRTRACVSLAIHRKAPRLEPAPAPCVKQGPSALALPSPLRKSNRRRSPTSPLRSCWYNSRCLFPRIWSRSS
jgi:sugar lactone lactonase YvrE